MKHIKRVSQKYFGIETSIAAIFYIVMSANIMFGGVIIRMTYLIAAYLVLKLFYRIEGRTSIAIAIGLLALAGIFQMVENDAKATSAAVVAFIFLVIGVLWQIAELIAERYAEEAKNLNKHEPSDQ